MFARSFLQAVPSTKGISPPPLAPAPSFRPSRRGRNRARLPGADPQLSTSHPPHSWEIDGPVTPGPALRLGLLRLPLEDDAVLPRLSPPLRLLVCRGTNNALPHRHGHLGLAEDAPLGAQRLHAHVGGLARRAASGKGARVGGGAGGVLGLPVGGVSAGSREDVGLGDEALKGKVVGEECGAVFGLVAVGGGLLGVGGCLCGGGAGVWRAGGLGWLSAFLVGKKKQQRAASLQDRL